MRAVLLVVALVSALVSASASAGEAVGRVGQVDVLTGKATRAPGEAPAVALRKKDAVYLGDTLRVQQGQLSLRLNDGSLLMLDAKAELRIDQASFQGLTRERFSATLLIGSAWAKVKKALVGSERNFELGTERAVAGVRGTEFRVDVGGSPGHRYAIVTVFEGSVYVRGQVKAPEIGNVAMLDDAIQAPDARPSKAKGGMAKRSAPAADRQELDELGGGAPSPAPVAEAARPARAAAAPPSAAPPAPAPKLQERSLDLDKSEAVFVGEDDDWRPMKPAKADRFAAFARRQK